MSAPADPHGHDHPHDHDHHDHDHCVPHRHPNRPDTVGVERMLQVRQPLDPVPLVPLLGSDDHRDPQIVGGVQRGQLGQHRAGHGPDRGRFAGDDDPGVRAQVNSDRLIRHRPVRPDEPPQRVRTQWFQFGYGFGAH